MKNIQLLFILFILRVDEEAIPCKYLKKKILRCINTSTFSEKNQEYFYNNMTEAHYFQRKYKLKSNSMYIGYKNVDGSITYHRTISNKA